MTEVLPRLDRHAAAMLAFLFGALALYALWSARGLADRWGASPAGLALLLGWAASAVVPAGLLALT